MSDPSAMTDDMQRLMRYAEQFGSDGQWLVNGEDAIPSLEALEEMGEIERNEAGDRWRVPVGEKPLQNYEIIYTEQTMMDDGTTMSGTENMHFDSEDEIHAINQLLDFYRTIDSQKVTCIESCKPLP